ncbi:MAG: tyrosine-type recombinase/integrase [Rhodospirillaceae bacterium]|nr:tyrosine-type recombinase/integrase [Rhodospirillaceae bacterium]
MTLTGQAASYAAMKQATGLVFAAQARLLGSFAAHAEAQGDEFVKIATALDWASQASSPNHRIFRLRAVRGFAGYLHAEDERHEVPHRDALGRRARHRPPPHLLSTDDIGRIMNAALDLPRAGSTTPHAVHAIIGLLAATGMRPAEATGLRIRDLTGDGIEVHNAKFGAARLLPLHRSVRRALDAWLGMRGPGEAGDPLFIMPSGRAVRPDYLTKVFIRLARGLGLRGEPGTPGPRLYDLRHSFATRALEGVKSGNRRDASRHMLALSTYLGHARIADTYWYLEATPVLLDRISAATEAPQSGEPSDD